MKAIVYARCSTEDQATEGVSLEVQISRCSAFCAMQGLQVVDVIQDPGVSGGKALGSRPGGKLLLQALQRGDASHVVCLRLDRAFRNATDALRTIETWEAEGTTFSMVDMGGIALSTSGPMARCLMVVMAAFAELEVNMVKARTKAALAVKREQGIRLGRPPVRRDNDPPAVLARELRAQGRSLRSIGGSLQAAGHLTPTGAAVWSVSQVARLVRTCG